MDKDKIELCSNETLMIMLESVKKQAKTLNRIAMTCIVSMVLMMFAMCGSMVWFAHNFEYVEETTTVDVQQDVTGENGKAESNIIFPGGEKINGKN